MNKFTPKVTEQLKYYVYVYFDPRTDRPFYIGKGKGNRVFSHLGVDDDSEKTRILKELHKAGSKPRIEILKYGLTEEQALLVEATAIDLMDIKTLTNRSRGHGSRFGARASVEEVQSTLSADPVKITDPVLLININREFRYGMTALELYDATRSAWKLGERREAAKYAISVYRGVVREVYEIAGWHPGGATIRGIDRTGHPPPREDRWEFVGKVATEPIRKRYIGKSVSSYFPRGNQNPVKYVNCGKQGAE